MNHIENYLEFIKTIEGIKSVTRTAWTKTGRHESTAEHSWRLSVFAAVLADEFPELDMQKVITLCLIHDIGELYTGDISAAEVTDSSAKTSRECEDVHKIFGLLPEKTCNYFISLWEEYALAATPEARFVKALDKAETIIQHNQGQNPPDFDYEFNLTYGKQYFENDSRLEVLRQILDKDTQKTAGNSNPKT